MNLITFLTNLDGSDDRLNSARAQLDQQGIAFTRVSAFDGRGLNLTEVRDYDEAHAVRYMGRKLKGGELGCYYSHLDCARRFLASDATSTLWGFQNTQYKDMIEKSQALLNEMIRDLSQEVSN